MKLLNATTTLRQWEKVTVEKQNDQDEDESTDKVNEKKFVTKLVSEQAGLCRGSSRAF